MTDEPGIARLAEPVSERDHTQGPADAPSTLVLYGDYECPCTRRAVPVVRELRRELGDQLRFAFRNFPLFEIHPDAVHAAEAAEAAAVQGAFWPMFDLLIAYQRSLEDADLRTYAAQLGLDAERFERDVTSHAHAARIEEDVRSGEASGVAGTPTFFVDGLRHDAGYDHDSLLAAISAGRPGARG